MLQLNYFSSTFCSKYRDRGTLIPLEGLLIELAGEMKGMLYIGFVMLLILKSATTGLCDNSIIPANNLTKQKSFIKPTRYKAVSSYVKKAKKVKVFSSFAAPDFTSHQLEGDDMGSDEKEESSQEDSIHGIPSVFHIPAFNHPQYSFSLRRYTSFVQFNIPPPKYN